MIFEKQCRLHGLCFLEYTEISSPLWLNTWVINESPNFLKKEVFFVEYRVYIHIYIYLFNHVFYLSSNFPRYFYFLTPLYFSKQLEKLMLGHLGGVYLLSKRINSPSFIHWFSQGNVFHWSIYSFSALPFFCIWLFCNFSFQNFLW